eukprot:782065-Pelagomonas_calceolata.AAC.1
MQELPSSWWQGMLGMLSKADTCLRRDKRWHCHSRRVSGGTNVGIVKAEDNLRRNKDALWPKLRIHRNERWYPGCNTTFILVCAGVVLVRVGVVTILWQGSEQFKKRNNCALATQPRIEE